MIKGRKGQHGVGLAIKEKIVKKAGEDDITIECISARLLKARISIKSDFVTFVVKPMPRLMFVVIAYIEQCKEESWNNYNSIGG